MFFKKNSKLEALIGASTELNGDIQVKGTLRIDGKFTGNIDAEWVIVGDHGSIKGDIRANCVIIGGNVHGNVKAEELVDIKHTGRMLGDIHTKKLSVAEGGVFDGYSHIQQEEAKVIDFPNKESASN
ncbi:MAG TPA: polymer-forming cytoskeletal protein [Dissulfurispiraceae bacterium]